MDWGGTVPWNVATSPEKVWSKERQWHDWLVLYGFSMTNDDKMGAMPKMWVFRVVRPVRRCEDRSTTTTLFHTRNTRSVRRVCENNGSVKTKKCLGMCSQSTKQTRQRSTKVAKAHSLGRTGSAWPTQNSKKKKIEGYDCPGKKKDSGMKEWSIWKYMAGVRIFYVDFVVLSVLSLIRMSRDVVM